MNYPEYVRQEDKPEIYAALRKLNEDFDRHGIVKIPYVNGRIVDRSNDHYAAFGLDPYLIRDEGGDVHEEVWNDVADMAPVCPGTGFWQDMVRDFCLEYQQQCGFDGFYIDQIGSFFATRCYDESHGHPLGGGSWWNESYHRLIRKVRDTLGEDKILTTESCCESYIDVMDMMLILDQDMILDGNTMLAGMSHQQPVPLFNMIYGDYSMSYGSGDHFDIPQPQFSYALVRNLLWGFVPTVEGVTARQLENPDAGERMDMLRQVSSFYHENKDVFFNGRLSRLPEVEGATRTAELPCNLYGPYTAELPELLAAQWEDATGAQHLFCYSFAHAGSRFTVDGREIIVPKQGFFEV